MQKKTAEKVKDNITAHTHGTLCAAARSKRGIKCKRVAFCEMGMECEGKGAKTIKEKKKMYILVSSRM